MLTNLDIRPRLKIGERRFLVGFMTAPLRFRSMKVPTYRPGRLRTAGSRDKTWWVVWAIAIGMGWLSRAAEVQGQPPTAASPVRASHPDEAIGKVLDVWLESADSPGVAAAIVRRGEPTRLAAAGLRKLGDDATFQPNDKVHLGSCTKAMTAVLVAMLVQDGRLDWDDSIGQVLPELADQIHPDYRAVTLEQLLCHHSGMPANAKNWWLRADADVSDARRAIALDSLQDQPVAPLGSKFVYSNLGYMMAGLMAESRTGKTWEELMQQRIFEPLNMSTAGFGPTGSAKDVSQPWGHASTPAGLLAIQRDNPPALGPAGRVHCSIGDWAKFARLMLGEHPERLNESLRQRLMGVPDRYRGTGSNYGYGWVVVRRDWAEGVALAHNGSNTYWSSVIWIAPNRGVAFLAATNAATEHSPSQLDDLVQRLIRLDARRPQP